MPVTAYGKHTVTALGTFATLLVAEPGALAAARVLLAAVSAAVLVAVLLVTDYVAGALPGALITGLLACMLAWLWFAVPLTRRQERR